MLYEERMGDPLQGGVPQKGDLWRNSSVQEMRCEIGICLFGCLIFVTSDHTQNYPHPALSLLPLGPLALPPETKAMHAS